MAIFSWFCFVNCPHSLVCLLYSCSNYFFLESMVVGVVGVVSVVGVVCNWFGAIWQFLWSLLSIVSLARNWRVIIRKLGENWAKIALEFSLIALNYDQKWTTIWAKIDQKWTEIWPKIDQKLTKNWPKINQIFDQKLTRN